VVLVGGDSARSPVRVGHDCDRRVTLVGVADDDFDFAEWGRSRVAAQLIRRIKAERLPLDVVRTWNQTQWWELACRARVSSALKRRKVPSAATRARVLLVLEPVPPYANGGHKK
jgi:hypothetical protein